MQTNGRSARTEQMVGKLTVELERLRSERRQLERRWRHVPRWLFGAVVAVPAAVIWGLTGAVLAVVAVVGFVLTLAYLLRVRRDECAHEIGDVRRELARLAR